MIRAPDRDAWELALFRGADERRIPVLAICRGFQLVNVARGGTLHQHLPEALGTERFRVGGGVFASNSVEIEEGSRLAALVGQDDLDVHSYHHQGVDQLGDGLVVTARTDDGLPQAFESDGRRIRARSPVASRAGPRGPPALRRARRSRHRSMPIRA